MKTYDANATIGLLSDSHGRRKLTYRAIETLKAAGADVLIHLGDFETTQVIEALAGTVAHIVFGNCDWNMSEMTDYATRLGLQVDHPIGQIQVGTQILRFSHGDYPAAEPQAILDGVSYYFHGHTHLCRDEMMGETRVINPGALCRATRYTVATLNPQAGQVDFLPVD